MGKTVPVYLISSADFTSDNEIVREVKVPKITENILNDVYYWGQNDFQPISGKCSVSVGDVISLDDGVFFMVAPLGFRRLTLSQLLRYVRMDSHERWMFNK